MNLCVTCGVVYTERSKVCGFCQAEELHSANLLRIQAYLKWNPPFSSMISQDSEYRKFQLETEWMRQLQSMIRKLREASQEEHHKEVLRRCCAKSAE